MSNYMKLLVAIDLSNESDKVISRARQVAAYDDSKISLVHVVEPIAAAYPIDAYAINMSKMQEDATAIALERLAQIGSANGVPPERQYVMIGTAATEIKAKADELGAELVVIGSHGRSGWQLLLGSTANRVLHGANCDILTVRVGD